MAVIDVPVRSRRTGNKPLKRESNERRSES